MYIENAGKGKNSFLAYIFTVVLVTFGYFFGQMPMLGVIYYKMLNDNSIGKNAIKKFFSNPDFSIFHIDKNLGFLLLLMMFVFALFGLLFGVKKFHDRPIGSLFGEDNKVDFNRILWASSLWMIILLIFEFINYLIFPQLYSYNGLNGSFLVLLIISFVLLPLQTSFEELFVRGYLFQSIGYNTRNIWIAYIASIIIFAALHGSNPEIGKYGFWSMMTFYIIAGIILGLTIILDDRIELSIGIHTATNIFGATLLTYEGAAIQTGTLFSCKTVNPIFQTIEFIIGAIIFYYFASKKFRWNLKEIKNRINAK